jgi:hypothetical protein
MGPVLFNIYLNDLIVMLENFCQVYNYADDNTLSFYHHDVNIVKMNLEMSCTLAVEWFKNNYMKVNTEKFQFMIMNTTNVNVTIEINETIISPSDSIKLLGVTIDKEFSFNDHIKNISSSAAKQINVLSRLSHVLSLPCKIKLLDAFILSNFNYCSLVYHNCKILDARKLENLFKRALRFVYMDFTSNYKELLVKSERSPLYVIRQRTMLLAVYKILHDKCPPISKDFFKKQYVQYNLRNSNVLIQPIYHTLKHGYNSFRYQGAMLWNKIGDNVKSLDFNGFKCYVMKWEPQCNCGSCLLRIL